MYKPTMDLVTLIRAVKPYPYLYDKKISCDVELKTNKWNEIGRQFDLTGYQTSIRWRSIKNKYILLKRKEQAYPGTPLGQQLQKYKHAKLLTFLDDCIPKYNRMPPSNRPNPLKFRMKPEIHWKREHVLLLIRLLSNYNVIYDNSNPNHKKSNQRWAAIQKITNVLKKYIPQLNAILVSRKIKTVRSQYSKEKRVQKQLNPIQALTYKPKLWFYEKLKFLDEKRFPENINRLNETNSINEETTRNEFEHNDLDDNEEETVDDDEEFNNVDEWKSSGAPRPFFEVEWVTLDKDEAEKEAFDDTVEEIFFQEEKIDDERNEVESKEFSRNQGKTKENSRSCVRNDLYVKCTGLLENLSKQIKPLNLIKHEKTRGKDCNCKKAPPSSLLGKMIESELATVSEQIYVDAKWKIVRILEEAQRKSLHERQNETI